MKRLFYLTFLYSDKKSALQFATPHDCKIASNFNCTFKMHTMHFECVVEIFCEFVYILLNLCLGPLNVIHSSWKWKKETSIFEMKIKSFEQGPNKKVKVDEGQTNVILIEAQTKKSFRLYWFLWWHYRWKELDVDIQRGNFSGKE